MGWLIQMLLEAVREQCSQFIIDMMEIVNQVFTELLSCNLDLFEELFSVVKDLYREAIVPLAIAILLLILIWQLLKGMFGKYLNAEEPIELVIRSCICLFMVTGAKRIVNYVLDVAGTPYDWVTGTHITVVSFADFTSAAEAVTSGLGIDSLNIQLLMVIIQFMVAWNYLKLLFIMAERYVLLGVFSYTAPLAFATGGSKATNNILSSWSKMFGGQVVLIILDAWCLKVYLSGYGNMMASGYGFTKFFAATLCLVGFGKIVFKLDSYMASLGVNLGRTSPGMGGLGVMMMLGRVFSQFGGSAGGHGAPSGGRKGPAAGAGKMASGMGGPIPMGGPSFSEPGRKTSSGADSGAMAGNGSDMGVPLSGQKTGASQGKPHGMPKHSSAPENRTFGTEMGVPSCQDIPSAKNSDFTDEGKAANNMGFETPLSDEYSDGPFSGDLDSGVMSSDMGYDENGAVPADNFDGAIEMGGNAVETGPFDYEDALEAANMGGAFSDQSSVDAYTSDDSGISGGLETGTADNMSIGSGDSVDTSAAESMGTMNAGSVLFDDGNVAGSGISFDSGYQSANMGEKEGFLEPGRAGSSDGGIQAVSGMSGGGQGAMGQQTGVTIPQNYQQFERDGVKYARFAADEYEKPNTPHRVVETDGKRFYEVKMEPVQAGIKATLQKDGKVHYEKTYREVLPEVPKKKQKADTKKENPSGNRTKRKNNSNRNRRR